MRMECGGSYGSRAIAQESRIWLKVGYRLASVDVEDLDTMLLRTTTIVSFAMNMPNQYLRSKDRCVLVHAQSAQMVCRCKNRFDALVHADVPQLDLTTAATTD